MPILDILKECAINVYKNTNDLIGTVEGQEKFGIGAGGDCDGQVLVMHDMLGINTEFKPRFLRKYLNMHEQVTGAVQKYISDIKSGEFPNESEQY